MEVIRTPYARRTRGLQKLKSRRAEVTSVGHCPLYLLGVVRVYTQLKYTKIPKTIRNNRTLDPLNFFFFFRHGHLLIFLDFFFFFFVFCMV